MSAEQSEVGQDTRTEDEILRDQVKEKLEEDDDNKVFFRQLDCIETNPGLYIDYLGVVEKSLLSNNEKLRKVTQQSVRLALETASQDEKLPLLAAYVLWTLAVDKVRLSSLDYELLHNLAIIPVETIQLKELERRRRRIRRLKIILFAVALCLTGWMFDIVPLLLSFI